MILLHQDKPTSSPNLNLGPSIKLGTNKVDSFDVAVEARGERLK